MVWVTRRRGELAGGRDVVEEQLEEGEEEGGLLLGSTWCREGRVVALTGLPSLEVDSLPRLPLSYHCGGLLPPPP